MGMPMIIVPRSRRRRKLEVIGNKIVFRKKMEHSFELPPEIAEWARLNQKLIDWLVFDSPIASSLRHPNSVRSLILLLYARANNLPIFRFSKEIGVAHEQLYRIERLLTRHGIRDAVYKSLLPLRM